MIYNLSILDLLNPDKSTLELNKSHFAIYTGIAAQDIPKGLFSETSMIKKNPRQKN